MKNELNKIEDLKKKKKKLYHLIYTAKSNTGDTMYDDVPNNENANIPMREHDNVQARKYLKFK